MKAVAGALASAAIICALFSPVAAEPFDSLIKGEPAGIHLEEGVPSPEDALGWWLGGSAAGHAGGVAALFAGGFAVSFLHFATEEAKGRERDGGVLGSARVKTGAEAVRGSDTWDGRSEPRSRGYVYGYSRGRYLFESGTPHCLVVGQTGSGKTRYQIIPTIDLLTYGDAGSNVVVSDVKGELVELLGDDLEARGYDVLLLDTQHPGWGSRYNPLGLVCERASVGDSQGAEEAAEEVAAALVPDEGDAGQSHWTASARGLLAAVILYVALSADCPAEEKHMATVCRIIDEGTEGTGADPAEPLKGLLRGLPVGHPARAFASQFLSSGGNEMRSILSTLKVHTRIFSSSSIAWMTSGSDIDPMDVLSRKTAVFLRVMDEGSPYNAIFAVFFDQLYRAARLQADGNGGTLQRRLAIVGDEWGNLPKVACLPSMLSLGRSYGISWYGCLQSLSQLNKYGERGGRRVILANCGVKVALKLGEAEDRQYFSELVGKTTRHTRGRSEGTGRAATSSTSYSEHADDVIHPWEWTTSSPSRDGAVVVKQAENGVPARHSGTLRAPLADCTKTPTRSHFDLGSREHEAGRRRTYQARLEGASRGRAGGAATWSPAWPKPQARDDDRDEDDDWSAL